MIASDPEQGRREGSGKRRVRSDAPTVPASSGLLVRWTQRGAGVAPTWEEGALGDPSDHVEHMASMEHTANSRGERPDVRWRGIHREETGPRENRRWHPRREWERESGATGDSRGGREGLVGNCRRWE